MPRWLTVFVATFVTVSAILSGGVHVSVAAPDGVLVMVDGDNLGGAGAAHCVGRDDLGSPGDDGSCCVSGSACAFCVPVTASGLAPRPHGEPAAVAPPFVMAPGEVPIRLRPPKLVVTA